MGIIFVIKKNVGTITTYKNGWAKELNVVSWNNGPDKYDIRDWDVAETDHGKMSKGITLTEDEAKSLLTLLKKEFEEA